MDSLTHVKSSRGFSWIGFSVTEAFCKIWVSRCRLYHFGTWILQKSSLTVNPTYIRHFFAWKIHTWKFKKIQMSFPSGLMNPHKPTVWHFSHRLCEGNPVNQVTPSISKRWLRISSNSQRILLKTDCYHGSPDFRNTYHRFYCSSAWSGFQLGPSSDRS